MTEALALARPHNLTNEQVELLKRTIAQGTTNDELALFVGTANRLGLDPFARQIHAIKRRQYDKASGGYVEKMTIQVGVDGFRAVADRSGADGQEGPFWCGSDGKWTDVWLGTEPPSAARVVVFKKGSTRGYTGIATYRSYVQTDRDGKPNRQWTQMADVMLAKCAECLALRKAHPSQLSGVYAPEEMDQSENDNRRSREEVRTDRVLAEQATDAAYGMDDERAQMIIDAVDAAGSATELNELVDQLAKLPEKWKAKAKQHWRARMNAFAQPAAAS